MEEQKNETMETEDKEAGADTAADLEDSTAGSRRPADR